MAEFARVVAQLGDLVEEETAALRNGNHAMLAAFNYRKSHGFLEFSRAMSGLSATAAADPGIAGLIVDLRAKLVKNQKVLKVHLEAAQEVTSVLSNAICECESDGTYSPSIWRTGT